MTIAEPPSRSTSCAAASRPARPRASSATVQPCLANSRAVGCELRTMARAVPAFLKAVPVHYAPHVCAAGRMPSDRPIRCFVDGNLAQAFAHDGALALLELID